MSQVTDPGADRIIGRTGEPSTTYQQQVWQDEVRKQQSPGLIELVGDAISSNWVEMGFIRALGRRPYTIDPGFNPYSNDDTFNALTQGLDQSYWRAFDDATSLAHAQKIREQQLEVQQSAQNLAAAGWGGIGLSFAAAVLDPAAIALAAATGGLAGPYIWGSKLSRLSRFLRGGALAAGENVALIGAQATVDPNVDEMDALWAGAAGYVMGGGGNLLFGMAAKRLSDDIDTVTQLRAMGAADPFSISRQGPEGMDAAALKAMAEARRKKFLQVFDDVAYKRWQAMDNPVARAEFKADLIKRTAIDDEALIADINAIPDDELFVRLRESTFDPNYRPGLKEDEPPPQPAAGDGSKPPAGEGGDGDTPDLPPAKAGDYDADSISDAPSRFSVVRFGVIGQLTKKHIAPTVRWLTRAMGDDNLRPLGNDAANVSADTWGRHTYHGQMSEFDASAQIAMKQWMQEEGVSTWDKINGRARTRFFNDAGRVVRMSPAEIAQQGITNPHILKAADAGRQALKKLGELGHRHGVFKEAYDNPEYLWRLWSLSKLDDVMAGDFGVAGLDNLLAGSMRSANLKYGRNISDEDVTKAAQGLRKALVRLGKKTDVEKAAVFSNDNEEILREMLTEANVDPKTIDNIVTAMQPPKGQIGAPRSMSRVLLDENYQDPITGLRLADMLENNLELLVRGYARQVIGHSALNKIFRKLGERMPDDEGNPRLFTRWTQVQDAIKDDLTPSQMKKLEILYRSVMGLPQHHNRELMEWTRRAKAAAHINVGGQLGLASVPELFGATGQFGFKVMLKQMPALRAIQRDAITGKLKNKMAAELEYLGLVDAPTSHSVVGRFDDRIAEEGEGLPDRILRLGVHVSNHASGLYGVNTAVQRMAALGSIQTICERLLTGKPLPKARLADLGLDSDKWARLQKAQRVESIQSGHGDYTILSLNLDGWEDQEAAAILVSAIRRWSGNVAQQRNVGALSGWMSHPVGGLIMQFRDFTTNAWERQLLHRVDQAGDMRTYTSAVASTLGAALVYYVQTNASSIGRSDREEFLKERLDPATVGAIAFSRGGWSSFIPSIIDTADKWTGGDGTNFQFGRSSGLDSRFSLSSIPAGNMLVKAEQAVSGTFKTVRGELGLGEPNTFSSQDFAHWTALSPYRRVYGYMNFLQAVEGQFPEEE